MTRGRAVLALLVVGVLVLGAFSGCAKKEAGKPQPEAVPQVRVLRLSCGMAREYNCYKDVERIAAKVAELSKGALKVEVYGEGSLVKDQDATDAVLSGAVEMTSVPVFWVGRVAPLFRLFEVPALFFREDALLKVYDGDMAKKMGEQLAEKGGVLLGFSHLWQGCAGFASKKPVHVPKDLKGMKLRVSSVSEKLILEASGAQPISLSGGELYMALQRGTIDGFSGGPNQLSDRKLYEVVNNCPSLRLHQVPYVIMINKKLYDSLSPDLQKAVAEAVKQATSVGRAEALPQYQRWEEDCKKHGVNFIEPTPQQWAEWEKLYQTAVYPAIFREVPELEAMVAEVRKWQGR